MKRQLIAAGAVLAVATGVATSLDVGSATAATATNSSRQVGRQVLTTSQASGLRAALRNGTLASKAGTVDICAVSHAHCRAVVLGAKSSAARSARPVLLAQPGAGRASGSHANAVAPPIGYGADDLATAYGLNKVGSRNGTIVVIGAGAYPTLESDLAIYRSTYGLPACTSAGGCFRQINYKGGAPYRPATDPFEQYGEEDIAVETALDVDMASAACPKCKIISMQVPLVDGLAADQAELHAAILHFATGVQTAKRLGAAAVSISYGYPTDSYSDTGTIAKLMTQPGMAIVSSSGDDGFLPEAALTDGDAPQEWPQDLSTVTSAGGTSLYPDSRSPRKFSEVAWNKAGSGCTDDVGPAVGQPTSVSDHCDGQRAASDISAVADPYTGVAVYDSYAPSSGQPNGFITVGGTSASSPFLAGLYARAPRNPGVVGPNTIYAARRSAFNDVTLGSNASPNFCQSYGYDSQLCVAGVGWDGPTGLGTPKGLAPFAG